MIVKSLKIVLSLVMLGIVQQGIAQDTIIISDYIENTTSGKVKIIQSDSLRNRLIPKPIVEVAEGSGEVKKAVGYRIQVFSDNNQRTKLKLRLVNAIFPFNFLSCEYIVYISHHRGE